MRWDIDLENAYAGPNIVRIKQWDYIARTMFFPPCAPARKRSYGLPEYQPVLAHRRESRRDKGKSLRRLVYIATFADGRTQRLSFSSAKNKPIDYAAGYNVSMIIGHAVPVRGMVQDKQTGELFVDPHFAPASGTLCKPVRKTSPATLLKQICRALNEGEIDAAMAMARAA